MRYFVLEEHQLDDDLEGIETDRFEVDRFREEKEVLVRTKVGLTMSLGLEVDRLVSTEELSGFPVDRMVLGGGLEEHQV